MIIQMFGKELLSMYELFFSNRISYSRPLLTGRPHPNAYWKNVPSLLGVSQQENRMNSIKWNPDTNGHHFCFVQKLTTSLLFIYCTGTRSCDIYIVVRFTRNFISVARLSTNSQYTYFRGSIIISSSSHCLIWHC